MNIERQTPPVTKSASLAQLSKLAKFNGNDDREMVEAKKKFISVLIKNGEEFGEVLAMAQTVSKLGPACLEFLYNYFEMYTLFESEKMESFKSSPSHRPFPLKHVLYDLFLKVSVERSDLSPRAIPNPVKQGMYALYGSYLAPDAAVINPYLHINIRNRISSELVKMHTSNEASVNIFDEAAIIAIETLFWIGYPRYLNYKGGQMLSDKISKYQRDWEQSIGNTYSTFGNQVQEVETPKGARLSEASKDSGNSNALPSTTITTETSKSSIESTTKPPNTMKKESSKGKTGFLAGIFGNAIQKELSKEAMVETLQNPKLYKKFEKFVKGQHCEENLLCFQYFLKLEARTRKISKGELEPCLARFLDATNEKVDRITEGSDQALVTMGSENEVNIPSKLRNDIEAKVRDISNVMIPMNVFDHAIDHVLELLYLNSFTKFVKK